VQREHAANYQTHLAHGLQEQLRAENDAYLGREEQERQAQILQEEQRIRIEQQQRETAERIREMQRFAEEESQQHEELRRQELRRQESMSSYWLKDIGCRLKMNVSEEMSRTEWRLKV